MDFCMLIIGGNSLALRAKRALGRGGVRARVKKISSNGPQGCRWGVEIAAGDLKNATALLMREKIPYEWTYSGR